MPSKNKKQQKFMQIALAYKRGELENVSQEIKDAADSMSEKELQHFADKIKKEQNKGTTINIMDLKEYFNFDKKTIEEEKIKKRKRKNSQQCDEIAIAYNKINTMLESIYKDFGNIGKLAEAMSKQAVNNMITEDDDWFDQVTIKRNQKELQKYTTDFVKTFNEVKKSSTRLQALHEEIGFILDRYFDL